MSGAILALKKVGDGALGREKIEDPSRVSPGDGAVDGPKAGFAG
jgi:hypothetical protein